MVESFLIAAALLLAFLSLVFLFLTLWWYRAHLPFRLTREARNPILAPIPEHWWESEAVFNPAAFVADDKIHLFYRALGRDGISRLGYAVSEDGVHFERLPHPAYDPPQHMLANAAHGRGAKLSYETLSYDTVSWGSGGGWGGSEDPRAVLIDDEVHITFTAFEGWSNVRIMLASLPLQKLQSGLFNWSRGLYLSPPGEIQKNWVLFPEKIRGKYAVLHNIYPEIGIAYFDPATIIDDGYIKSRFDRHAPKDGWDSWMRGAGAPPLKTSQGWLLLYHAIDKREPTRYKVGVMLLDLKNPKKILYRSSAPILEPDQWYENDWKPGVVYATGAVIFHGDLLIYYGGGDKYVAMAKMPLKEFMAKLMHAENKVAVPDAV